MTEDQEIRAIALEQAIKSMNLIRDNPNYWSRGVIDTAVTFELYIKEGFRLDE